MLCMLTCPAVHPPTSPAAANAALPASPLAASLSSRAEPPESFCRRESFYSGRHAACLDHIRAYYRRDVDKLFS